KVDERHRISLIGLSPTPAKAGAQLGWRLCRGDALIKVVPSGIEAFNFTNLPSSLPFFHAPLPKTCFFQAIVGFKPDEQMASIIAREAWNYVVPMFPYSPSEIGGRANIDRSVASAGHDVNEALSAHRSHRTTVGVDGPRRHRNVPRWCRWRLI